MGDVMVILKVPTLKENTPVDEIIKIFQTMLKETGTVSPSVIIPGRVYIVDTDHKEGQMKMLRMLVQKLKPKKYWVGYDAWYTNITKTEQVVLPSHSPKRKEVLVVFEFHEDGSEIAFQQDYKRMSDGKSIVLGELRKVDLADAIVKYNQWNFYLEDASGELWDRCRTDFGKVK